MSFSLAKKKKRKKGKNDQDFWEVCCIVNLQGILWEAHSDTLQNDYIVDFAKVLMIFFLGKHTHTDAYFYRVPI